MNTGVYQIRNLTNGKRYIGSCSESRDGIQGRWKRHSRELDSQTHHSIKLQRAWDKYGGYEFVFEVLLYCDPENCLMYEQIALDCFKPEYNICKVAGSHLGMKRSLNTKKLMSLKATERFKNPKNHPYSGKYGESSSRPKLSQLQVDLIRGRLVNGESQASIARVFGMSKQAINDIKTQRTWRNV